MMIFLLAFWMSFANANPPFTEMVEGVAVDVTPKRVYIPQGFDNNDLHVQVVLEGELPSTCYDIGDTTFKIDTDNHKIYLHQEATYYSGNAWCDNSSAARPYVHVVDFKRIPVAGNYQVFVTLPDLEPQLVGILPISATSNPNPDDYLYAPVMDAHVEAPQTLVLEGTFKNACMSLKEVKIHVRRNHVIEVLPIATATDDMCGEARMPFDKRIELPSHLPKGRYLIHIRSLKSESVNKLVDL